MKLSRLFQPRKPAFWWMLGLNALSMLLLAVVRNYALTPLASVLVAGFALGNAGLGMFFTWQLLKSPAKADTAP